MKFISIVTLLLLSTNTFSSTAHRDEAKRLLELSGSKAAMETMADVTLNIELQNNPTLIPFEGIMREFLERHLGYEKVEPFYIDMYVETFTIEELKEMNAFYASSTGKKAVEVLPALMIRGSDHGASVVQENLDELQAAIAQEAERLKKLSDK